MADMVLENFLRVMSWSAGRESKTESCIGLWNLKAHPQGHTSSTRPHLLILPAYQAVPNPWWLSTPVYELMGVILIQATTYRYQNLKIQYKRYWPNSLMNIKKKFSTKYLQAKFKNTVWTHQHILMSEEGTHRTHPSERLIDWRVMLLGGSAVTFSSTVATLNCPFSTE